MAASSPYSAPVPPPPAPAAPRTWTATPTTSAAYDVLLGGTWTTFAPGVAKPITDAAKRLLVASAAPLTYAAA